MARNDGSRITRFLRALRSRTPDLGDCRLEGTAYLRHLQHTREADALRNPDDFVARLLPPEMVKRAQREDMERLLRHSLYPFYRYLLCRTLHYDKLYVDAVHAGIRQIVVFGAGFDTRAYRFAELLRTHAVTVIETDLRAAIEAKRDRIRELGEFAHVRFCRCDLNEEDVGLLIEKAGLDLTKRAFVMAEGVSPYVQQAGIKRWLSSLSDLNGSSVGYDFKFGGRRDLLAQRVQQKHLFRLPETETRVRRFHRRLGFCTAQFLTSSDLQRKHSIGGLKHPYDAEGLVVLTTQT